MGLFGFGRKKKNREAEAIASQTEDMAKEDAQLDDESQQGDDAAAGERMTGQIPEETSMTYEGRGEEYGPWDIDEDNAPDFDEYMSLGAFYIPFVRGIQLRIKASRADNTLLGATVTIGKSSLELEAFAAPKTLGLWDDVREDLLEGNANAKEVPGVFGAEIELPVKLDNGKVHTTRIVGVDGPRWMLRGIFSGPAAEDPKSPEAEILNRFFSDIVVDRGEEPLAPRDLIPMAPPLTPNERRERDAAQQDGEDVQLPDKPQGPFNSDQETETKTTLSRGPMFSELR
ncbi:hypothetical protein PG1629B_1151 [Bifidobacterium pseudolongum subsp. pseudolongum]|uniref:DUF3710 domain-containing protein n=1 Tax=Bifidobacterium pseudolongum TaxID=1694 RepID=UPI00101F028E|nr:DUF3710 domain-containing protein [Bifidobacterium pseudolongum]RYQ48224.1 hypothetical protein PG1629B_1151 [Bifidobacterium pseudolongum subsp. pseudolongum]